QEKPARVAPAHLVILSRLLALVIVDFLEIGVDDILVRAGTAAFRRAVTLGAAIHRFAELHRGLGEGVGLGGDRLDIVAAGRRLEVGNGRVARRLAGGGDLVAVLGERLLGRMDQRLALVAGLDQRAPLLVVGGVGLGVLDHLLDLGVGEAAGGLDA